MLVQSPPRGLPPQQYRYLSKEKYPCCRGCKPCGRDGTILNPGNAVTVASEDEIRCSRLVMASPLPRNACNSLAYTFKAFHIVFPTFFKTKILRQHRLIGRAVVELTIEKGDDEVIIILATLWKVQYRVGRTIKMLGYAHVWGAVDCCTSPHVASLEPRLDCLF
ncbi:hypothetical protein V6N13_014284 [Hibiscus sabdariffa]